MSSKDAPQVLAASGSFVQFVTRFCRARRANIPLAAMLAALSMSGADVSNAATAPKSPLSGADFQARAQAPIGHRQPRPQDLPPSVLRDEGKAVGADKALDQKLEICRKC